MTHKEAISYLFSYRAIYPIYFLDRRIDSFENQEFHLVS